MQRRLERIAFTSALLAALAAGRAAAIDFELGSEVTGSLRTQVAIGAGWRANDRKVPLVGKLNLPGQEQFCEDKDPDGPTGLQAAPGINCQTVSGNAAFLALPGYPSVNFDNGNLNYDRGDLVAAAVKVAPRLQLTWNNFGVDVSGFWFYDFANTGFTDYHPNNRQDNNGFQERNEPRHPDVEDEIGTRFELMDAYVSGTVALPGDRALTLKLGNQILSIGTTTLLVFNGLNVVNPPNANVRFQPAAEVREIFKRIPLLTLGSAVTEQLSVETFYAFGWEPVETPPIGGFFSTNDVVGAGEGYVMALFGKYREDPRNRMGIEERTQGNANQLSDAGRTLFVDPPREPGNGGEYGLSLNYFAEGLNNTSFTLAFLNLHSRLPIVSFLASELGCAHGSTNAVEATIDCDGYRTEANGHAGLELAPLDTVRVFADYPKNIRAFGSSFSTNLGDVAWTGELVYRPNQPLQVDVTDVGFAALQPIFPAETIPIGPINIPGRRVAAPDYVETLYRGNRNVQPGQVIRGYERFQTLNWNTSFLALLGASDNPFGADQLLALLELGAFQVLDMPPIEQLQLGTPGVFFHRSAGVDGTGSTTTNQDRLNPSLQESGYATDFAWGYRILSGLNYENVFWGVKLLPQATFFHDVDGRAALPAAEFIEGRKQASLGLGFSYESSWNGAVRYNWFFGGGTANALADRDYLQLNLSYDF